MWIPLGLIVPTTEEWLLFALPAQRTLFRAFYFGDIARANSWVWVRPYYETGEVGFTIKLYPKPQAQVFELLIPEGMGASRLIGCRKGMSRYASSDVEWQLQIEEWQ